MNVVDVLLKDVVPPGSEALVTLEASHTRGELKAAAEALAAHLLEGGARKGDFVAVVAENSFFSLAAYLGVLRAGCVAVPLPTNLSPEAWAFVVASTGLRVACLQARAADAFLPALPPGVRVVADAPLAGRPDAALLAALPPAPATAAWPAIAEREDLASVIFTSGSTGRPRGVMLTHRNLLANAEGIVQYLGLSAADRVMVVLPFYYSFGASLVHTHLMVGGTLVLDSRFMFPDKVLARMQETRCTGFAGVPSHYQSLLRRSKLKHLKFPFLKWVQQAGGKLPQVFVEELVAALPTTRVFVMYGATENTARIAYMPPEELKARAYSVGKAIPGVTVELHDEAGRPVPAGEVGEVVVSGDSVSRGYFQAPEDTAVTFRGGKLHTGDLATQDAEGYLTIVDRVADFLKCGGTRTSSKAVEDVLVAFPEVVEAAVVGVPDDILGEAVAAFVVAQPGAEAGLEDRLRAFCKDRLAIPLQPKVLRLLPTLPKNNAGKVQKPALRKLL